MNGVYSLDQTERRILRALHDKGPGMLMEVAVRTLDFPERVAPVLRTLHEQGLVHVERIRGGVLGNELWSITPQGRRALEEAAQPSGQRPAFITRMARDVAPLPNSSSGSEYQQEEAAQPSGQQPAGTTRMARDVALPPNSSSVIEYQRGVDAAARSVPLRQPTGHELEIELLIKLGDLAAQHGDTNEATKYYQQALKLVREKGRSPDA
jgi:DNA-binding MarR family transcriptional regulator